jgi:hypothetical protein
MNDRDRMAKGAEGLNRQQMGTSAGYNDVPPENAYTGAPGMAPANQPLTGTGRMNASAGVERTGRAWTRWQNWANVVLGIILFISPWYTVTWEYGNSSWNAWIIGVAIVIVALVALSEAVRPVASWINVILGIWLFISPWVLGFAYRTGMAWTAWIIGVLVFILALWAVSQSGFGVAQRRATV